MITSHTLIYLLTCCLLQLPKTAVGAHICKVWLKIVCLQDGNESEQVLSAVFSSRDSSTHHSMEHVSLLAYTRHFHFTESGLCV